MPAVSGVGLPAQQVLPTAPVPAKGILQRAKDGATKVWEVTVLTFQVAGGHIAFFAVRVLGFFSSKWALRLENGFLHIRDIWRTVTNRRREQQIQRELADLRVQVAALPALQSANEELTRQSAFFQQQHHHANERTNAAGGDRALLVRERDLLAAQNARLTAQNTTLTTERDTAQAAQRTAEAAQEPLRIEVGQLQRQVALLRDQLAGMDTHRELGAGYQAIVAEWEELKKRPNKDKTYLNNLLEKILPPLLREIKKARTHLLSSKEGLEGEAAKATIDDLHDLTGQVLQNLEPVLPLLTQHQHASNQLQVLFARLTAAKQRQQLRLNIQVGA
jgi:myosin heavy subunit